MPDTQFTALETKNASPAKPAGLDAFLGKAVQDLGAAMSAVLISIGDELGFYKELSKAALTPAELAKRTGTSERYVREWLNGQAAGGYVDYSPQTAKFFLNEAQALCLADPNGPVDLPGAYLLLQDFFHIRDRALDNFKTGHGMEWGEHHACLFHGTERFFRAGYNAHLLTEWLPAMDGVTDMLRHGGRIADVGCGHGASAILMAKAFPNSEFIGFDYHPQSIETATKRAREAKADNAHFIVADATSYGQKDFDLIAFFDCLHDMADPVGATQHARQALKPGGKCLIVEPNAADVSEDNYNPVGRCFYSASALICVPVSLAKNGPALGAQAGEKRLREIVIDGGGFKSLRRVAETPFNMVLEATA